MSVSVVIPVGPYPANKQWLKECLISCLEQTVLPYEIVFIDDGANLLDLGWLIGSPEYSQFSSWGATIEGDETYFYDNIRIYPMPWHTGISHAFNYGVMLAKNECVFMLGSDDTLEPTCLERCWEAYIQNDRRDAYYSVPIRYMDTGEIQTIPCNAAMVTKGLWRKTGGFPIETALGSGDAALLSIMMVHYPDLIRSVGQEHLYNYRRHPDIHTYKLGPWWTIVNEMRNKLTELHTPPDWTDKY